MEKSQTDFVQECLAEIATLKDRIAALEEKLESFPLDEPQEVETAPEDVPEDAPVDFTDMDMTEELTADNPEGTAVSTSANNKADATEDTPVPSGVSDSTSTSVSAPDETAGLHWRTDKPGLRVKNIRSGISLYDRALFIGTLFKEDFSLYENTIRDLNEFVSLDQAVDYIRTHFPNWDLHSDVVYNFMMSIRKKLG
jgi:hypothetical protein